MAHLMAVILAAGEGKRMKSKKSKLLHKVGGSPLVECVYKEVKEAKADEIVLIVGHMAEQIKEYMGDKVLYAQQNERLGTGHAVMQAEEYLKGKDGNVLILCGDTPLITSETILQTLKTHEESNNSATVITAQLHNPSGYGRIIRDENGNVKKIVEDKDASPEEKKVNEINSGMYCFKINDLCEALGQLNNNNSQGEYYLTDTLEILIKRGMKVGALKVEDQKEVFGINDRMQLAEACQIQKMRTLNKLMKNGVTIIDPASTYIDDQVEIGMDSIIYPSTIIEGNTVIGEDCIIGPGCRIVNSKIQDSVEIKNSVIMESSVDSNTTVGPFAYLRPGSVIGKKVKIGDFVEIKKSTISDGAKISHLTYVGDAHIGKNVNLGCGVVVVNYDGKNKNKTVVGDNAFVGCNVNLISPVEVKNNAYVAAGSTITEEVPENALAIARNKQVIKEDWVVKKGINRKD